MTERQDAIREAQSNRAVLHVAYGKVEKMRQEKETLYPGWSRAGKTQFTRRYNNLLDYIEQVRESLQDAPPEPLHPAEALGKLAEVLQARIAKHYDARRILSRRFSEGGIFWARSAFGDAINTEWHARHTEEIAQAVAKFEGDDLARWGWAMQVFQHVIKRETDVQMRWGASGWSGQISRACENIQAEARAGALGGWLAMWSLYKVENYGKLDARVQVWAELQEMEKSSE